MAIQAFGLARLGRDAEVQFTPDGTAVANLSLAFNYGRKGEDGKRPTSWVEGSLWGKLAEAISPYLLKGSSCAVTLEDLHVETFKKADGSHGSKLVARVLSIELAGSAPAAAAPPPPAPAPRPAARPAAAAPRPTTAFDNMDDDIPFVSCDFALDMQPGTERRMRRYHY